MTSARLDLRHLRFLLAAVVIMLGILAAAPSGVSAQPNNSATGSAEFNCWREGGTWTVEGTTGYCKGLGKGKDYKCHLEIGQGACEYLPMVAPTTTPKGPRIVRVENVGLSKAPAATPVPTYVAVESAGTFSEMSPLDE